MKRHLVELGSIATIVAGQSPPGSSYNSQGQGLPFFQGKAEFGDVYPQPTKWCTAPAKLAEVGDILISVRAPVGPTNLAAEKCCIGRGLAAIRPNPLKADSGFVHWAVIAARPALERKGNGSTFTAINRGDLAALQIPLPPLDEQRRIVGLLDRAAEIRRRTEAARAKARAIIPALFLDMFGDPAANPKGWTVKTLGNLSNVELRNGISPSKSGTVTGKVLTLSAITRGAFDPTALKESLFAAPLAPEQSVSRSSFLICRGNGNPEMVGRGAFPTADLPDTAFPDTIIALRGFSGELAPAYLSALWATDFMRGQIKAVAKTTNGTYKISQGGIMSFALPFPPLPLQTAFAEQANRLDALARALDAAAAKADSMAAALSAEVFG